MDDRLSPTSAGTADFCGGVPPLFPRAPANASTKIGLVKSYVTSHCLLIGGDDKGGEDAADRMLPLSSCGSARTSVAVWNI